MHDRHPYTREQRPQRRPLADIALAVAIGSGLAWWIFTWAAA
jgi:hypothetical protein